jgi:preprotein translocase subunit SecF
MFEILSTQTRIPFMKLRLPMIIFSVALTAIALYSIATKGFRYGVDFAGGVQMVLEVPANSALADTEALRARLSELGLDVTSVQTFGTGRGEQAPQLMVNFSGGFMTEANLRPALDKALGTDRIESMKVVGLERAYIILTSATKLDDLQKALMGLSTGLVEVVDVAPFGSAENNEFQISFSGVGQAMIQRLSTAEAPVQVLKVDVVGAKVGADLRTSALLSLLITAALIFIYIFIRFDFAYAPGVVAALIHDILIAAGVFSLLGLEFDLTIVAALLTVAGYSINDTIVIFDRVREVALSMRGKSYVDIIDMAINQTLARTMITSLTTIAATLALFLFGGPVIHGFATAFLVGIVVGSYSSVFVACPVLLWTHSGLSTSASRGRKQAA